MIQVESFTKRYGSRTAVSDVSFTACPGSVTGLLGVNGAGKTTILKAVCGLHYATSGRILVQGADAAQEPVRVKEMVGYVSEQPALLQGHTVRALLEYAAKIRLRASEGGATAPMTEEAVARVCEQCALESVMDRRIGELSKGFRQRLSFAQALVHNPPVLVLDEPVSGLDPAQIRHMRGLIRRLSAGKTVLLSTHLMQEVEAVCDTVHIISGGRLVASGTAREITQGTGCATFEDAFLALAGAAGEIPGGLR